MLVFYPVHIGKGSKRGKIVMEKTESRIFHWVLVVLILLFFAIPICSLAVTDHVSTWPKCSSSFIYNFFLK